MAEKLITLNWIQEYHAKLMWYLDQTYYDKDKIDALLSQIESGETQTVRGTQVTIDATDLTKYPNGTLFVATDTNNKYILIDNNLCLLNGESYAVFTQTENGLVPAPNSVDEAYLCSDGTWKLPEGTKDYEDLDNKPTINNVELIGNLTSADLSLYTKPDDGIPASDLADDVLPTEMVGASETEDGKSGLVPKPSAGGSDRYLRSDGSWTAIAVGDVTEMVGATDITSGSEGMVPLPAAGDNDKFLSGDGKWTEIDSIPLDNIMNIFN